MAKSDGYDLLGAFIGSEGCFGIALEVTVRLTPNPQGVRTILADFMSIDAGARAMSAIIAAGILPAALEMMDGPTIRAVEASIYAAGYPADADAVLLIELDGLDAGLDADVRLVEQHCLAAGARTVRIAANEAERARLWQGRKKAFGAMGRIAPDLVVQDAVIPRTKLPEVLREIAAIAARWEIQVCNVFHAGDGNLHPNIGYDSRNADESRRVGMAMRDIMRACIDAGGTITGEHGIGLDKLEYMPLIFSPESLAAQCALRDAFDPERRANPGKVVPVHSCREWTRRVSTEAVRERVRDACCAKGPRVRHAGSAAPDRGQRDVARRRTPGARGGVALARARRRHHRIRAGDLTLTARAGTTLANIARATAAEGQWLALDPHGSASGTLGATIATASAGPLAHAFGTPRDNVLGIEAVTGTGEIVRAGGRVVKNVAGFDLTRLFTGAWGTLARDHRGDGSTSCAAGARPDAHAPDPRRRGARAWLGGCARCPSRPFALELLERAARARDGARRSRGPPRAARRQR